MTQLPRSYDPLTLPDLRTLRDVAVNEHDSFIRRNPHLAKSYGNSLVAICLCQGAASHYLDPRIGIKDFDVWHFYLDDPKVPFPYRAHRRIDRGFKGKPLDFLKRSISRHRGLALAECHLLLLNYLLESDTQTKRMLLRKAVIGLYPQEIFDLVIWPGLPAQDVAGG